MSEQQNTNAQNFNPTTDGLDFVTVNSSETLLPGFGNMGLYFNEAWNALPRFSGQPDYHDHLLGMDLNLGMGLANRWDAGISLPFVLDQSVSTQGGFNGRYSANGLTEVKLNTKYRLTGDLNGGLALMASANFNLIRNNPYVGSNAGPTFNLEGIYDRMFGSVAAAINFGYRWRNSGSAIPGIAILPFKNQWIASAGANFPIPQWDSKLIAEVFGSLPASTENTEIDRQRSSLEALLGIKHDFTHHLAGHFGFGHEILPGLASPSFRMYAGVNFQFGPIVSEVRGAELEQSVVTESTTSTVETTTSVEETIVVHQIEFEFNSSELTAKAKAILKQVADRLNATGFKHVTVQGHTDSVGAVEYNQRLSEQRSNAIRHELIRVYGFNPDKLDAIGYGETRPIADNGNYQGRELNRRVEFKITH